MGEGSVIDLLTDEGEMTGPRPYGYCGEELGGSHIPVVYCLPLQESQAWHNWFSW